MEDNKEAKGETGTSESTSTENIETGAQGATGSKGEAGEVGIPSDVAKTQVDAEENAEQTEAAEISAEEAAVLELIEDKKIITDFDAMAAEDADPLDSDYHLSWDVIIPVFEQFCIEAEAIVKPNTRDRISFCNEFMKGVWNNKIAMSNKALVRGINWLKSSNQAASAPATISDLMYVIIGFKKDGEFVGYVSSINPLGMVNYNTNISNAQQFATPDRCIFKDKETWSGAKGEGYYVVQEVKNLANNVVQPTPRKTV